MTRSRTFFAYLLSIAALQGCGDVATSGPDPMKPLFYILRSLNNRPLPTPYADGTTLISASLVPYAVGRTIDQRLVNDRTGRGATGGNTRDTTVLRGQMMDIRVLEFLRSDGVMVRQRDSSIVDVEIRDTVFIITRPFPDKSRVSHDTGAVSGRMLIVPTRISRYNYGSGAGYNAVLQYEITR